jgi:hypothetical protein
MGMSRTTESRVPNVGASVADVTDRGFYGIQLRRLQDFFPPERIHVLQLERCLRDLDGQLAATYRFLGLDDAFRPPRRTPPPLGTAALPPLEASVAERLAEIYAQDAFDLADLVPGLDLDLWPSVAGRPGGGRARRPE